MLPAVHRCRPSTDLDSPGSGIATKHVRSPSVSLTFSPMSGSENGSPLNPVRPPRSTRRSSSTSCTFRPLELDFIEKNTTEVPTLAPPPPEAFCMKLSDVTSDSVQGVLLGLRSAMVARYAITSSSRPDLDIALTDYSGSETARSVAGSNVGQIVTLPSIGKLAQNTTFTSSPRSPMTLSPVTSAGVNGDSVQLLELPPTSPEPMRRSSVKACSESMSPVDPASMDGISRSMLALEILQSLFEKHNEVDVRECLTNVFTELYVKPKSGTAVVVATTVTVTDTAPLSHTLTPDNCMRIVTLTRAALVSGTTGKDVTFKPAAPPSSDAKQSRFARRPSSGVGA